MPLKVERAVGNGAAEPLPRIPSACARGTSFLMGCPVCMVFSPSASARGTGLFYLTVQFVPFSLRPRGTSCFFYGL